MCYLSVLKHVCLHQLTAVTCSQGMHFLFFFREHYVLGRKVRNLRMILIEDFFFVLENTTILRQKLAFVLESHTIFCPVHKVLHKAFVYLLHDQPQRSPHATDLQLAPLCSIFLSVVQALSKRYSSKMPDFQINSSVCYVINV